MQITQDTDSFRYFPYPPDGKENNGGFDLIKHPEDLDKIKEFEKFPELRKYIKWIMESKDYKSYGCDGGMTDIGFTGYIEFSFRDSGRAKRLDLYQKIFDDFEAWVHQEHTEMATSICQSLSLGMADIWYEGTDFGRKISLYFLAQSQEYAVQLLDIFFSYLDLHENEPAT